MEGAAGPSRPTRRRSACASVLSVWKGPAQVLMTLLTLVGHRVLALGITPGGPSPRVVHGLQPRKRLSKDKESFRPRAALEGVFAPETAAHASGTSALLPMLALGDSGLRHRRHPAGGPHGVGTQSRPAPVRGAQGTSSGGSSSSMYLGNVVGHHGGSRRCRLRRGAARALSPPSRR